MGFGKLITPLDPSFGSNTDENRGNERHLMSSIPGGNQSVRQWEKLC